MRSQRVEIDDILARNAGYDRLEHYQLGVGPTDEFADLPETPAAIKNIGWTLGNDCPYRCTHCYSLNAREPGKNMSKEMIDRVVDQLEATGVETVNLGGNEPLFTNGPKARDTMLPYIIERLTDAGIIAGLTTSGITIIKLYEDHRDAFDRVADVDVSFDSPFEDEHNENRGAKIYRQAVEALEICQKHNKPRSCIMAGMNWNFTIFHIEELCKIAARYEANVRINPLKPIEPTHMSSALPPEQYYQGFSALLELCDPIDLGEPPIAAVTGYEQARRCPCGRTSFRIHSITPDGRIPVSPCVYLHDYKAPYDLLETDLITIVNTPQFRAFRQRHANPGHIKGCEDCDLQHSCGGGCAARSYLYHSHLNSGEKTMRAKDPYCPREHAPDLSFPQKPQIVSEQRLVHMDYLCTWIGRPR